MPLSKLEICKEVRRRAEALFNNSSDLNGKCAICSWAIADIFRQFGYNAQVKHGLFVHESYGHCWVESDGEIYDVTATQFSRRRFKDGIYISKKFPKIYITNARMNTMYMDGITVRDKSKYFKNWPKGQYPSVHAVKKLVAGFPEILERHN